MTVAGEPTPVSRPVLRLAVDFGLPLAAFYGLRAGGVETYRALVIAAVVSASIAAVTLARYRRLDGMAAYMAIMMLGSVGISLLAGSTQFLLAREAVMTAVTGVWFLAGVRARRPLVYLFSKPLLEGRFRWPSSWDQLWEGAPRFRRMWQVSSVLWGIGSLADAALRVVMAYTLPADVVPALGTALYAGTSAVLIAVTTVYYISSGVYDPHSPLYRQLESTSTGTSR